MLTTGYTQEEYTTMAEKATLMAIHLVNNQIWVGLIYEKETECIIFNPLLILYYLGEDKKYHINFDYVSIVSKDSIFILPSNNVLFCATLNQIIIEQYKKYYNIGEAQEDDDIEIDTNSNKVVSIKTNKILH